jgi:hypothetical protein
VSGEHRAEAIAGTGTGSGSGRGAGTSPQGGARRLPCLRRPSSDGGGAMPDAGEPAAFLGAVPALQAGCRNGACH